MTAVALHHQREDEPAPGPLDLAADVSPGPPPPWLAAAVLSACGRLDTDPDAGPATAAVAARHGRPPTEVLLTAGVPQAFSLVAQGLPSHRAAIVHPQSTGAEIALQAAGWDVHRIPLPPGAPLRVEDVPDDCTLVVIGNPTNLTGTVQPRRTLTALRRPGRVVLVDETLLDAVPGEPESLADAAGLAGLLVTRSPIGAWGLAGLPLASLLGDASLIAACARVQPQRSLSTPALAAALACCTPRARQEAADRAEHLAAARVRLRAGLLEREFTVPDGVAPFVLARHPHRPGLHAELRRHGIVVHRADTVQGLPGPGWVRITIRDDAANERLFDALDRADLDAAPAPVPVGRVILVGGGPGAPGSITLDGLLALHRADVVVADHLAPLDLLDHVGEHVEVIDAAKHPRGRAMPQQEINAHLIQHARAGRTVVRLKGGDPYVFGRGGEEVEACAAAGVPVDVLSGVSSAIAGPAALGVPVTHRGLTHGFTVVSGHLPPGHPQSLVDWAALARSGMTIVILMGVATLPAITAALSASGLAPTTPAAVVSNAGNPGQRRLRSTLTSVAAAAADAGIAPPAIAVIGAVAGLDLGHS